MTLSATPVPSASEQQQDDDDDQEHFHGTRLRSGMYGDTPDLRERRQKLGLWAIGRQRAARPIVPKSLMEIACLREIGVRSYAVEIPSLPSSEIGGRTGRDMVISLQLEG